MKINVIPKSSRSIWRWVESTIITVIVLLLGYTFSPENPYFINASFPWTWFAPILIALRYGVGVGIYSAVLVIASFLATQDILIQQHMTSTAEFPKMYFLGGILLTMLTGEFSTLWSNRERRAMQLQDHAEHQLKTLSKTYFVTRISHDRLEENLITKPVTLRSAILELRELLTEYDGELTEQIADRLLQLLTQYCSLESAALYKADNDVVNPNAISTIGQTFNYSEDDELIKRSVRKRKTTYYSIADIKGLQRSNYLVSVPIIASDDTFLGLVVVKEMPFLALQHETLQVLTVLLGYFADQVWAAHNAKSIHQVFNDCPADFAVELMRLNEIKRTVGLTSSVAAFKLKSSARSADIISRHSKQLRALDYSWHRKQDGNDIMLTIMPFSAESAVEGYMNRVENWLKELYGLKLGDEGVNITFITLTGKDPVEQMELLLDK